MIFDLHAHYPMHLLAGDPDTVDRMTSAGGSMAAKFRAATLKIANKMANYPGKGDKPAVTLPALAASKVRVIFSTLYSPFDEIDADEPYGTPPKARYFTDLLSQIDVVEQEVAGQPALGDVAHNHVELDATLAAGKVALIHAVEGGFHLGESEAAVKANVATLARRGVACITIAHLFWRHVATNSPALPFLSDQVYSLLFMQPKKGLTVLGRALVTAMAEHGILVDVTHMSARSIDDTLALLDQLDPNGEVPLIATHSACQAFSGAKYCLSDGHIAAIARRRGVIGLIACSHWMAKGMKEPKTFADTMDVICRHIDHIHDVVKDAPGVHQFTAFGSDHDGFIKPALPGLETPAGFDAVEQALITRYGAGAAADICSGNALRVLQSWKGR